MLKPLADGRIPSVKDVLRFCWQEGLYVERSQVVPLKAPQTSSRTKKAHAKQSVPLSNNNCSLIGVTVRLLEGGGAAAFYITKGKVVLTGRNVAVTNRLRAFVEPFTVPISRKDGLMGWGLPDPADFSV